MVPRWGAGARLILGHLMGYACGSISARVGINSRNISDLRLERVDNFDSRMIFGVGKLFFVRPILISTV